MEVLSGRSRGRLYTVNLPLALSLPRRQFVVPDGVQIKLYNGLASSM